MTIDQIQAAINYKTESVEIVDIEGGFGPSVRGIVHHPSKRVIHHFGFILSNNPHWARDVNATIKEAFEQHDKNLAYIGQIKAGLNADVSDLEIDYFAEDVTVRCLIHHGVRIKRFSSRLHKPADEAAVAEWITRVANDINASARHLERTAS